MIMKMILACGIFVMNISGFSQQEIILPDINTPGGNVIAERKGIILAENIFGPRKVIFSGLAPGSAVPVLSKEEQGRSNGKRAFDKLEMSFSGKIYSPNMLEPVIFENKKPEELVRLEFLIFPNILEQTYTLFMDLSIKANSSPIGTGLLDDAGIYRAVLNVSLIII